MNSFKKLADGSWAIACNERKAEGETVTVTLRSGATKQEKLGGFVYATGDLFVYSVAPKEAQATQVGNMTGVLALFARAKKHLKIPAIVLHVAGIGEVKLNVAGERARVPGSITVAQNGRYGEAEWFGRILTNGTFESSRKFDANTVATLAAGLERFAADPAAAARDSARLTGKCVFCNIRLTDERSTSVGYGETCASHYSLPYPKKSQVQSAFVAEAA
jgi:hypothetical protein